MCVCLHIYLFISYHFHVSAVSLVTFLSRSCHIVVTLLLRLPSCSQGDFGSPEGLTENACDDPTTDATTQQQPDNPTSFCSIQCVFNVKPMIQFAVTLLKLLKLCCKERPLGLAKKTKVCFKYNQILRYLKYIKSKVWATMI